MAFTPVFPEQHTRRPISQGSLAFRSKLHPLLSTGVQSLIRAHFSIGEWILIGCSLQAVIILISPFPVVYALTPTVALALFKVAHTIMITYGLVDNHHMKNVRVGRHSAVFPEEDGSFARQPGNTVGGSGMVVFILSTKCNHPLGMLYPPYAAITGYAQKMFRDLEVNAEENGFLGYSNYNSMDTLTKPILMTLMYFKSIEHLHKFAHGDVHRKGWDWWNGQGDAVREITISHETYAVPEGNWENIYQNAPVFDLAATRHAIQTEEGETKWVSPMVDAKKGFKSSDGRMGTVKRN